jgi:FtsZ-interacting cell division protein ZipA
MNRLSKEQRKKIKQMMKEMENEHNYEGQSDSILEDEEAIRDQYCRCLNSLTKPEKSFIDENLLLKRVAEAKFLFDEHNLYHSHNKKRLKKRSYKK